MIWADWRPRESSHEFINYRALVKRFINTLCLCVANSYSVASFRVISKSCRAGTDRYDGGTMRDPAMLFINLRSTIAKLMRLGGGLAPVAESLLLRHQ